MTRHDPSSDRVGQLVPNTPAELLAAAKAACLAATDLEDAGHLLAVLGITRESLKENQK